jgi:hypothetical protein
MICGYAHVATDGQRAEAQDSDTGLARVLRDVPSGAKLGRAVGQLDVTA